MKIESPHSARLGKIARLPLDIRQQLNARLADNEPAQSLVDWLNALPEVKEVLADLFDGRPITHQNVSAWKLGGFRDWERHQEVRARARDYLEESDALGEEVCAPEEEGCGGSFLDRVADRMGLALLDLFREAELSEKGPQRTREMLEIVRELRQLRRGDHERQRAEVAQERWSYEQEMAEEQRLDKEREKEKWEYAKMNVQARSLRRMFIAGLAAGTLTAKQEEVIREFFASLPDRFAGRVVPSLPEGEELAAEVEAMRERLRRQEEEEEETSEEDETDDFADEEDEQGEEDEEAEEDTDEAEPSKAMQGGASLRKAENFSE